MANSSTILLHQCCAPCSAYPVKILLDAGAQLHGYFYNPNIHPLSELERRIGAVEEFNSRMDLDSTIDAAYGIKPFVEMAAGTANRCGTCYDMRIERVAGFAAAKGFDAFTTTLLYSKYQKHDKIKVVCRSAAQKYGIRFHYEDYRVGWQVGIDLSKEMGLYRQKYCGCVFSIADGGLSKSKKQALIEETGTCGN